MDIKHLCVQAKLFPQQALCVRIARPPPPRSFPVQTEFVCKCGEGSFSCLGPNMWHREIPKSPFSCGPCCNKQALKNEDDILEEIRQANCNETEGQTDLADKRKNILFTPQDKQLLPSIRSYSRSVKFRQLCAESSSIILRSWSDLKCVQHSFHLFHTVWLFFTERALKVQRRDFRLTEFRTVKTTRDAGHTITLCHVGLTKVNPQARIMSM